MSTSNIPHEKLNVNTFFYFFWIFCRSAAGAFFCTINGKEWDIFLFASFAVKKREFNRKDAKKRRVRKVQFLCRLQHQSSLLLIRQLRRRNNLLLDVARHNVVTQKFNAVTPLSARH